MQSIWEFVSWLSREVKEPYNRFICTINKSFPRVKRERGRMETKKGLWISDRWGGFIWLQRLVEPFRPSFGSLFALSVAEAKHVMCLSPRWKLYPCCCKQKDPNNATFSQSGATCQWLFFPILHIYPLFPSFFGIHFYWSPCFVPRAQWSSSKRSWDSFPRFLLWRGACWEYLWLLISEVV